MKNVNQRMVQLRKKIDLADKLLLKALGQRFEAVAELGRHKKNFKIPVVQKARWAEVVRDRLSQARELQLSPQFTLKVFNLIHAEAVKIQRSGPGTDVIAKLSKRKGRRNVKI